MQIEQLKALVAVVEEGTFEAAARRLSITPSAVSQRIRALEKTTGRVLVSRGTPCVATEAGESVLRAARQVDLVIREAREDLAGPGAERTPLTVAVNADSLATWMAPLVRRAARWDDAVLRLRLDDQEDTRALLAGGEVLGAVTTDVQPVVGCSVQPLGVMRYHAVANPALLRRHGDQTAPDLATLPVVQFNRKDTLQDNVLRDHGITAAPWHEVPSSESFALAVRAGLGWAMLPEQQIGAALETGRLVLIPGVLHQDVELHWQVWKLGSRHLERLTDAVVSAAAGLRPPRQDTR